MTDLIDFVAMSDQLREAKEVSDVPYEASRVAWDEFLRLNTAYRSLIGRFMDDLNGATLQLDANRGPLLVCGHYAQPKERMRTGNELWCYIHCNWQEKAK